MMGEGQLWGSLAWLSAIAESAKKQGFSLPPFTGHGMGNARSVKTGDGRFITFKRRLVANASSRRVDGIEWTLWLEARRFADAHRDLPRAARAEAGKNVTDALKLLKGRLLGEVDAG